MLSKKAQKPPLHPWSDFDPFEPKKHMRIYKKTKQNTMKFADPNKNEEYYNKKYKIDQEGIEFLIYLPVLSLVRLYTNFVRL